MADRKTAILDAAIAAIASRGVRGLRVEEVAREAGVAVSLLYYHFGTREGLVRATLEHANDRAVTAAPVDAATGFASVERTLLAELDEEARDTSVVWGEILASAMFEPGLRDQLRAANATWVDLVAERIRAGQADGSIRADREPQASAERLTALVDGLSDRWLAGLYERERAVELLAEAVRTELLD